MNPKQQKERSEINKVLVTAYGEEIAEALILAFNEVQSNFRLGKWKPSELDGGHFVEVTRRILEIELFGTITPFSKELPRFDDAAMKKYEQASEKCESFRLLIPRVLLSIYSIRNKRGVGHVGTVSPNEMDSSVILSSIKWVLAEIVRIKSGLSPGDTQRIVNSIIHREIPILWKKGDIRRILDPAISAKEQTLILLLDEQPLKTETIREAIEYMNVTRFTSHVIMPLHKERMIYYDTGSKQCHLTSKGEIIAEKLVVSKKINI
jgi:hypothetical protein